MSSFPIAIVRTEAEAIREASLGSIALRQQNCSSIIEDSIGPCVEILLQQEHVKQSVHPSLWNHPKCTRHPGGLPLQHRISRWEFAGSVEEALSFLAKISKPAVTAEAS